MSRHREVKQAIIDACLWLEEKGYFIGTYGNVSVRVEGGLIITPSRVDYRSLTPEDMVWVSDEGQLVEGVRLPSSELEVHRCIYLRRADIGAIVHTHSLAATALACMRREVPVIVEEQAQVIGSVIPCTRYVPAGQHRRLGEEAARALGDCNALLLANHGAVSCAATLEEALFTCVIVERVAQMYLLTSAAGGPLTIPQEFVISERERFLYRYGKAEDHAETE
jgi:L-fuculose-phosphate aldolase